MPRRKRRWKPLKKPKESIIMPREEYEALQKKKRKPSGIYYDDIKVKK